MLTKRTARVNLSKDRSQQKSNKKTVSRSKSGSVVKKPGELGYMRVCVPLFFWLNVIFFETLGTFVECILRIVSIISYILLFGCCSTFRCGSSPFKMKSLLQEIVINAAVMLSLLLPCCIILSFRRYSDGEDWDILPIPTIVGVVDLRRYFVIVYGYGSAAVNIDEFGVDSCQDKWGGGIIIPPSRIVEILSKIGMGQIS